MGTLLKDLRFAIRAMRKAPVVTVLALVSLAVGIGANSAIFSLINAVFLRSLPVERPDELVMIWGTDETQGEQGRFMPISRPNFEDYRDRNEVFSGVADMLFAGASLSRSGAEAEQVGVQLVSGNYFELLGLRPAAGRLFLPHDDEVPGRDFVAVLSHHAWKRLFGADPGVVGASVSLNGQPFTVVGVAPEGFNGTFRLGEPDLWVPTMAYVAVLPANRHEMFSDRRALISLAFARLAPGVSVEQAQAALQVLGESLEHEHPVENATRNVVLMPLEEASLPPQVRENFSRAGALLMAVVSLVLLIACANVANLLLSRAMARRREIAIRLSVGAGRGRLVRQLLAESLLLGSMAGVLGLVLAFAGRDLLWALRPPFLADAPLDLSFDLRVLAFTTLVALATGLVFGIVPALAATRPEVLDDLKEGVAHRRWGGFAPLSPRNLLVMVQVALSFVALLGAGLFVRSLGNALEIDPGFATGDLGLMTVNVAALGYDRSRGEEVFDQILERARTAPGVRSVALAGNAPLFGGAFMRTVLIEGRDPEGGNSGILTPVDPIGEGFFETTGIGILRGRSFSRFDTEDALYVAIFNETAAQRFWPGEDALGQRFKFFGEEWDLEVVGIAETAKYGSVGEEPQPRIYLPRWQHYQPAMTLLVRSAGEPAPVLGAVRDEVRRIEPALPVTDLHPMTEIVRQSLWAARMGAGLLGLLGTLALLLAVAGIYGVTSYSVRQRDREIGIRMALGAQAGEVVGLLLRQGMLVVGVGLVVGLAVAWYAQRAIKSLLFGVGATDLAAFGATLGLLAAVAFLATLLPARRASRIDPVVVLKADH